MPDFSFDGSQQILWRSSATLSIGLYSMIRSREVMHFVHAEPLSETSYQQILSELRQGGLSQTNQSGEHRPLNRSKSEVRHLQLARRYQGCRQL
jgi:hypothetical protein